MARGQTSKAVDEGEVERRRIEAAQHNPNLFAALYEDNFERVYAYVARRVHGRDEAQELTAEVFHKAFANLRHFEWRGVPFVAWLFRIAANAIADRSQRAAKERQILERAAGDRDHRDPEPSDVEEIEERARLFRLVDQLPADQRRVIVMRFAEEKSIREISLELGRSEGAVKQLQFRGLQNLRERLGVKNV